MLSIFHKGDPPPCPSPFNLAAYVLKVAEQVPDRIALEVLGRDGVDRWTYDQLRRAVLGTGSGLLEAGLNPGQIVLMRLGNTLDFPIAYLGALSVGLVPVPTSSALTETEVAGIVQDLSPAAVLRSPDVSCCMHDFTIPMSELRDMRALPAATFHMGDPNRLGYVIYTSGTSGVPRAVGHAHRAIWARRMMFDGWYGLTRDDRVLHAGAFNWTYTLGTGLMDPWTCGATALIPEPGTPVSSLPGLLGEHKATIFAAAPGVYRQMLSAGIPIDLPDLRHGLSAGEKLPVRVANGWRDATNRPIFEAYGMSECSTFISASPASSVDDGALGRPQSGRHVALLDRGAPVLLGEEGTIAVHRSDPGLMLGYLNAPKATADKMQGDWFVTGDQGRMDETGQITYLGRNDDMMNAGGFRVSPIEVEQALISKDGIDAVAVTDVEIKADARVIAAFYTGPVPLDEAELQVYARSRLARYKQPRLYIHLPDLPMSANGKVSRRMLRDEFKDLE